MAGKGLDNQYCPRVIQRKAGDMLRMCMGWLMLMAVAAARPGRWIDR